MRHAVLLWLLLAAPVSGQEATPKLQDIAKKLGIEIIADPTDLYPVKTYHGEIAGAPADEASVLRYGKILEVELAKVPKAVMRKTKTKRIILARDIAFAGQKRAAVPDFENDQLHLDVVEGAWNMVYQQTVFHHEFFHIVDWKDDGLLYEDKKWKKLNDPEFRYGAGGVKARGEDQWPLDDSLQGFLNKYSTSGVEEDKAELYANLMVRPNVVATRARKDPILAKKVVAMKELLRKFSTSMDKAFWESIER